MWTSIRDDALEPAPVVVGLVAGLVVGAVEAQEEVEIVPERVDESARPAGGRLPVSGAVSAPPQRVRDVVVLDDEQEPVVAAVALGEPARDGRVVVRPVLRAAPVDAGLEAVVHERDQAQPLALLRRVGDAVDVVEHLVDVGEHAALRMAAARAAPADPSPPLRVVHDLALHVGLGHQPANFTHAGTVVGCRRTRSPPRPTAGAGPAVGRASLRRLMRAFLIAVLALALLAPAAAAQGDPSQHPPKMPDSTKGTKKCGTASRFGSTFRVFLVKGKH